jgi:phosphoesterase RecJ-like protein
MNWDSVATKGKTTLERACLEEARRLIKSAQRPLLICHIAPDGDAVGSLVGLGRALRQAGLEPILACPDPIPPDLSFIPDVETVTNNVDAPFDLVVSLDCSDRDRLGHLPQLPAFTGVPLLNIDHHLTNSVYGDVNVVDPHASSTAEIVLHLLDHMAVPLDTEIATALLTGIVADTRGFRTSNVTPQVMVAALRLMEAGASLPCIAFHSLDSRPTSAVRLWGAALSQLQIEDRVIWTSIPLATRRATGYTGNGDAGLASFLLSAEDADIAVVFVEREEGDIEVGLRAVAGFDVAQVAFQFGGGGHALAAGCNLPGPMAEAQSRLLAALKPSLAEQRARRDA